jgi:hypothetical protein
MDFDFSTETITPDTTNLLTIGGTGGLELPVGTTGERPVSGLVNGTMRYNTDLAIVETYSNSSWSSAVNPGTITSVNASGGSTGLTFSGGPITASGTLTLGGTLAPASGGTGVNTSSATNGQLLIGNGSGLALNTLTAGTAISVTNGAGTITIANTGVTSNVAGSGISVSGATGAVTITNTGVTAIAGTAGNITASAATGSVTLNLATAGTPVSDQFRKITTDTFGRVTATSAVTSGDITTSLGYTPVNKAGDTMTGSLVMSGGSTQITLPNAPVAGTDATNKNYVDAAVSGLSWKQAVRVATTTNGTLATAFANGSSIDGVTISTGDRILIKNQTTQTENGIYIVQVSGAPVRSSDADTGAELVGATVFVDQGTANANTGWTQTTDAPITIGSSNIVFVQFSGSGAYTAGTGLTLSGNQFSLTSPVLATLGGTGQTVYAVGDILYANTTTTLARLADVATGNALISGGVSTAPSWGKIGLTTHVSGTLPIANGGTGLTTTPANGQIDIGNGTGFTRTTITAGTGVSVTNGAGTITLANTGVTSVSFGTTGLTPNTATTGAVTVAGVLVLANGGTGASLTAVNGGAVYSTGSALAITAAGTSGQVLTSNGAGAPTWTTPTSALQLYKENPSAPTAPSATGTNAVAIMSGSSASATNAIAIGAGTAANVNNIFAYANGNFATAGDAQTVQVVSRRITTDATTSELFIDGSAQRLVLPNNSAWTFTIRVAGRRTDATGGWAMYTFQGGITRDASAATTSLRGSSRTIIDESAGALNCTISADTTNGSLNINVTGIAAQTYRWVATTEITQVTN